jgi:HPt (histidine-containing phosphotransfer) domain-containing protein
MHAHRIDDETSASVGKTRLRYTDVENEMALSSEPAGTLESDVGPEVYQELLAAFLTHLSLQVAQLDAAVTDHDLPGAQGVAHQIKGTACSFGADRLDELAKRVLRMDGSQVELLGSLVSEIDAEVRTLRAAVAV